MRWYLIFISTLFTPSMGVGQSVSRNLLDTSVEARIARIETSLYPIYNIKGQEKAMALPEMMREKKIVGLSMAFIDHGRITWTKCYGYADLQDSMKMAPTTILRAASLSKPVTAMVALHLVEEGKLGLNENINEQLKGWKLPENEFTKNEKVTVARIIGHTSGIRNDVHNGVPLDEELPSAEDIFSGRTQYAPAEVIYVPGERYKYSNLAYMVLAELLQDVTSREFERAMEEIVLKPCHMENSTYRQDLPPAKRNHIATGYNENMQMVPFYKHPSSGAGALWTTPSDLCLFLGEILNAYHNPNAKGKIISHVMATKVFERSDEKLGFNKNISDKNLVVRNDGSIPGYNCTLMASVTKNQGVVIMLNTGSNEAYDFLNYVWRAVAMEYDWELFEPYFYESLSLSEEELQKFEGTYSNEEEAFNLSMHNGGLVISSTETGEQKLVAIGKTSFLIPEIPMRLGFEIDSSGNPINLYVRVLTGTDVQPMPSAKNFLANGYQQVKQP